MAITNYIDSNGLRLMVAQLPSGAFDLYFSNGIISTCYTQEELQDFPQRNNPQSGNGVEKIEHKFKPTIMEKNSTGTSRQTRTPNRTTITTESYPRS